MNIDEKKCEILYVPMDKREDEFKAHYTTMPWLSIPYGDQRIKNLAAKYKIKGIPILIIVDAQTGSLVTDRGRKDIHERSISTIGDWAKLFELNKERAIKRAKEEALAQAKKEKEEAEAKLK